MTQRRLLDAYKSKKDGERSDRIDRIVKEKFSESAQPKTSSMLKVRLIDATDPMPSKSPILIIWNADESECALRENMLIDMQLAMANGMRGRDMQLSSGKYTSIREIKTRPVDAINQYKRKVTFLSEIDGQQFRPYFNEFDTIGYCIEMDEAVSGQFQSIYIVDSHANILCLKFWNGLKEYAYDDIVSVGKFLIFSNLNWRSQQFTNVNGVLQAFATEFTICSECPKSDERKKLLDALRESFKAIDIDQFTSECCEIIRNKNPTTPLRPSNTSIDKTPVAISKAGCSSAEVSRFNRSNTRLTEPPILYGNEPPPLQGYYACAKSGKTPLRRSLGGSRLSRKPQKPMAQKENQNN